MFLSSNPARHSVTKHSTPHRNKRPAPAVKRRRARLYFEALEERTVPTILFHTQFGSETVQGNFNDGMQDPTLNLIFSGPYWLTPQGQQDQATMISDLQSVLSGPYLSGLSQYGEKGGATLGISWNDILFISHATNTAPTFSVMQSYVQTAIDTYDPAAAPPYLDASHCPIYAIISDPYSSAGTNSGYNVYGATYQNVFLFDKIHIIWVGSSWNSSGLDWPVLTGTFTHELAENLLATDSNALQFLPPNGSPMSASDQGVQCCDNEPSWAGYGYWLNGVWVAPYWSYNDNAFIVCDSYYGDPQAEQLTLTPVWNSPIVNQYSFTGTYDLQVKGDQLAPNYNDNIVVTQQGNTSVGVNLNSESANFAGPYPDQTTPSLRNININAAGGQNTIRIAGLPSTVTANITNTTTGDDNVIVGSTSESLAMVLGTVNVSNTSGRTSLTIDDRTDTARNITVTNQSVAFAGLGTINYTPSSYNSYEGAVTGVTALDIYDGMGANNVDVQSLSAGTPVFLSADTKDNIYGPAYPSSLLLVYFSHT
jgi:hypothetical protein